MLFSYNRAENARRDGHAPAAVDDRLAVCALGARALGFGERQGDHLERPARLQRPLGRRRRSGAASGARRPGQWKPIEGATRYEVLYPRHVPVFVPDDDQRRRRARILHVQAGEPGALWSSVRWRVRALRYPDKDVLKNRLPSVSYGPWEPTFTSVNPPLSLGNLAATDTVSDTWDKKGLTAPGTLAYAGIRLGAVSLPNWPGGRIDPLPGLHLHRRPLRQSRLHRLGGRVPAFAPRVTGGPLALPKSLKDLADWRHHAALPRRLGRRGTVLDATGKPVRATEQTAKAAGAAVPPRPRRPMRASTCGTPAGRLDATTGRSFR